MARHTKKQEMGKMRERKNKNEIHSTLLVGRCHGIFLLFFCSVEDVYANREFFETRGNDKCGHMHGFHISSLPVLHVPFFSRFFIVCVWIFPLSYVKRNQQVPIEWKHSFQIETSQISVAFRFQFSHRFEMSNDTGAHRFGCQRDLQWMPFCGRILTLRLLVSREMRAYFCWAHFDENSMKIASARIFLSKNIFRISIFRA